MIEIAEVAPRGGLEGDTGWPGARELCRANICAAGADVVVDGEGELTMEELLPALRSGTVERVQRA